MEGLLSSGPTLSSLFTNNKVQISFHEHLNVQKTKIGFKLQESFDDKMKNLEDVIRKQEDLIVKLQSK